MDFQNLQAELKYIEINGCCFNIEEKIKLTFAIEELKNDLGLKKVWLIGKITGIIKDYYLTQAIYNGHNKIFWCSSTSWVFSQLPEPVTDHDVEQKLKSINTFFTGEFDSILFSSSGQSQVVNAELGIKIEPKPITELDRLSFVVNHIRKYFAVPKGSLKIIPSGSIVYNEGFSGLNYEDSLKIENWQFTRQPQDPEILGMIERDESVFNVECLDSVAKEFPKNSWNLHKDATRSVATLKSHLWPGLYAYHRCNTNIFGFIYIGDGIMNSNLPFMV